MQLIVDGLSVNYEVKGDSDSAILFLHGWGDNHTTFDGLIDGLVSKYTAVTLDLPGFGKSESPKEDWDLQIYADFVAAFINKLGIGNPYSIIGHSNGGAIAIKIVANKLITPTKLVLLASSGVRSEYKSRKKILRIGAKTAKFLTSPLPKSTKLKIRKRAYRAVGSDIFVAEHLQGTFKQVVSEDILGIANQIKVPTLLLYGADDTFTPVGYAKKFNHVISNSKLVVLPGADHFVHKEKTKEVVSEIEKFLNA